MSNNYNYNKNYFNKIDTNEKAYWLGFIMSDGYIMDNRNKNNKSSCTGLRIRLSEIDKEHLEKFHKRLETDKPIKIVKNYGIYKNQKLLCESSFYSKDIVNDLYKLGLSSGNKSTNEKFIYFENNNLTKNFILGMFDGDGSFSIDKNNRIEWSIVSSKEMVLSIKDFIEYNLKVKLPDISSNNNGKNLFRIRIFSKEIIKKLFEFLYKNECSEDFLERKYKIIEKFYNNYSKK